MTRRSYAAMQALGAQCHRCPLSRTGAVPVPSEAHQGARAVLVAQHPGEEEEREGRPLCGPSGRVLMDALGAAGIWRTQVHLTNAAACRFPMDATPYLRTLAKHNKDAGLTPDDPNYLLSPFEACFPRLRSEINQWEVPNIIPLGGHAAQMVIADKKDPKILNIRGHTYEQGPLKILPTVNSAFLTRQPRWTHVFYQDIRHAFSWFFGAKTWSWPRFVNARMNADGSPARAPDGQMFFWVPSVDDVRDYLRGHPRYWGPTPPTWMASDLETDGLETGTTKIRCIGVGATDHVMVIPLLTCAPPYYQRFYSPQDESCVIELVQEWAANERVKKIGHNFGYFDRMVFEDQLGVTPSPIVDTVLGHKSVDAEMPHTLKFCAAFYALIHDWKLKDHGVGEQRDPVLWEYNGLDTAVNARIVAPILAEAQKRRQITRAVPPIRELPQHISTDPCLRDHAMQSLAVGLHRVGIPIGQERRAVKETESLEQIAFWQGRVQELLQREGVTPAQLGDAGIEVEHEEDLTGSDEDTLDGWAESASALGLDMGTFNPASHVQVRKLFELWDLPEPNGLGKKDMRTDTGEMRTGKPVLQAYMTDGRLQPAQRVIMHGIFMYRMWAKRYGTFARPSRYPEPGLLAARRAPPGERQTLTRKFPKCNCEEDGRVHANWNAHGTLVGRFSASKPNVTTYPLWFKPVVQPQPGHVLVGADVDQFHLRIIASLWGVQSLLEVFENPALDPHSVFAEVVMGDQFRQAEGYRGYGLKPKKRPDGKATLAGKFRDMAKTLRYAGAYGARPPTIYRVMRSAVDDNGRLQMPNLEIDQVRAMHDNWMKAEPQWEAAWKRNSALWKQQGYLESPILKRRRYFLDQKETDVYNYEILSCEGDIFGEITQKVVDRIPFNAWGPGTGLILQCHDALYVECPADGCEMRTGEDGEPKMYVKPGSIPDRVRQIIDECMQVQIPGWAVPITGAADVGPDMSKVAA